MECSDCSLAFRYSLDRWPRYPLARSRTTLRFLWALTARFTRAISYLPGGGPGYFPSNFLIFLVSEGARTWSLPRRRVRRLDLCSSRWFMLARRRITLPPAVILNRRAAPLWVFIFGMLAVVSIVMCLKARLSSAAGHADMRPCPCRSTLGELRGARGQAPACSVPPPAGRAWEAGAAAGRRWRATGRAAIASASSSASRDERS